jgi:hypothetical protein
MRVKLFFDENFSQYLARGLAVIQNGRPNEGYEVTCVQDTIGRGARDEDVIPFIARESGILITKDFSIYRTRVQWELCRNCSIGVFFFRTSKGSNPGYWGLVQYVMNSWSVLKDKVSAEAVPFGYRFTPRRIQNPEKL